MIASYHRNCNCNLSYYAGFYSLPCTSDSRQVPGYYLYLCSHYLYYIYIAQHSTKRLNFRAADINMKHGELRVVYMFVDRGRYALLEKFWFLFVFCENLKFFEEIN